MAPSTSKRSPTLPLGKRLIFSGIVLVVLFLLTEVAGFMACRFLASKLVFYPPDRGDYAEYLRIHDPVLGWPAPSKAAEEGRDAVGARISPAHPDRTGPAPLISCYGDSFTWSAEVGDADAWPEVLGTLLGVRVDNFGVGGYGSDQALIRWRRNVETGVDNAPVVILAHLSENVLRNLNQFRGLVYAGNGGLGFKPRFVLDDAGGLTLIPLQLPTGGDYDRFVTNPGAFLHHETFKPGSPEGARIAHFPYSFSAAWSLTHPRFRAYFSGAPHYMRFYDPAHPARGTQLTASILESFWHEATASGRVGVPVIIPTGLDIEYFRKHQSWPYGPLVEELTKRSVPVLDLGPILEARMHPEPLPYYFAKGITSSHFSERGYRLVAEEIERHLRADPRFAQVQALDAEPSSP